MRICTRLLSIILVLVVFCNLFTALPIGAAEADGNLVTTENLKLLATAMNTAAETLPYTENGFGSTYQIFNIQNPEFSKLFESTIFSSSKMLFSEGDSVMDVSQQVESNWGVSSQLGADIPLGKTTLAASAGASYNSSVGSTLQNKNYFSYQYLGVSKTTVRVRAKWSNTDLTNLFSNEFVKSFEKIKSEEDAKRFLKEYGSHVFSTYYFGGILALTNQIVSEENIADVYEKENKSYDISVSFDKAANAAAQGESYDMTQDTVNSSKTKSDNDLTHYGGISPAAMSMSSLFLVTQQVASSEATSYPYEKWNNSLNNRQNELIIKAENGVSVWDLVANSSYYNKEKCELLKAAYQTLYIETFSKSIEQLDENYSFLEKATYSSGSNTASASVMPQNGALKLQKNSVVELHLDKTYLGNASTSLALENVTSDKASIDGNKLTIKDFEGNFRISILAYNVPVGTINVSVDNSSFSGGTGTNSDPYILATADDFFSFINGSEFYDKNFKLGADIDLRGKHIEVGGASAKIAFSGTLDGNNKTISNATIISNGSWGVVGLFGINSGTISDLTLKNFKCINNEIIAPSGAGGVAAGILAGHNAGTIKNVQILDSAIRISAYAKDTKNYDLNVGSVVGRNSGTVSLIGVTNCSVFSALHNKIKNINTGGLIGTGNGGSVSNCYVRDSLLAGMVKSKNQKAINTGGLVGYIEQANTRAFEYCVVYNLTLKVEGKYGYICGENKAASPFNNCYYSAQGITSENAVGGKSVSGCKLIADLKIDSLNKSAWSEWTGDSDNMPILKKHANKED